MLIYILFPFAVLIPGLLLCSKKAGNTGRAVYCAYFGALVCALETLRFDVGTDYLSYKRIYEDMLWNPEWVHTSRLEKGYYVLQNILANRFYDYRIMFGVVAFIFAFAVAFWMYRYSSYPPLSGVGFVMYGIMFYSCNFLRQFFAAVIMLYAFEALKKKDLLRWVALVLFAACFHWSALIMIPFFFIMHIRLQPVLLAVYGIAATFILVYSWNILGLIRDFYERFDMHSSYLYEQDMNVTKGISLFYFFGYALLFIIAFMFRNKLYEKNKDNIIYMNCLLFVVLFDLWGCKHSIISRFDLFFVMPAILGLCPDIAECASEFASEHIKQKYVAKGIACTALLCAATYFYGSMIAKNGNGCTPYFSWLQFAKVPESTISQIAETEAPAETTVTDEDYDEDEAWEEENEEWIDDYWENEENWS